MNVGIKLGSQTSFMEKGIVQCKESRLMKLTGLWAAQTLTKELVVSKPFKNNDALTHSLSLAFLSYSHDRF